MSFTRIYLFNETQPAIETVIGVDSRSFKIKNPDSGIFENVWGRNSLRQLNREE
jgi:hypothetical protein